MAINHYKNDPKSTGTRVLAEGCSWYCTRDSRDAQAPRDLRMPLASLSISDFFFFSLH